MIQVGTCINRGRPRFGTPQTKQIAADIWGRYWNYSQLMDGWYLPGEANTNFIYGDHRITLANYYSDVVGYLHTHANNMSVMISPWFNVNTGASPADWTSLWTYVFNAAPIDIIALQDSAGDIQDDVGYQAQIKALPTLFAATNTAIMQSSHPSTQLWDNLDLYDLHAGGEMSLDQLTLNAAATRDSVSQYTNFGWFSHFAPSVVGNTSRSAPFSQWNLAGQ